MWRGACAALVWYVAVLLSIRFGQVQPDPVPAVPLNAVPDASVPPPPEPAGDCGEWDDTEECET